MHRVMPVITFSYRNSTHVSLKAYKVEFCDYASTFYVDILLTVFFANYANRPGQSDDLPTTISLRRDLSANLGSSSLLGSSWNFGNRHNVTA